MQWSKLYDISPTLHAGIGTFPGDTPFEQRFLLQFERGNNLELSSISTSTHVGAHADAPKHYHANGVTIEHRPLELYLGSCQVISMNVPRARRIYPRDIATKQITEPRVLFKTDSFPDPDCWNSDFCSLSPELVRELAAKGVRLIGIDTPSVDPEDCKDLASHQAIYAADMGILEGIVLKDVPEGVYTLIALPLKIANGDAAPVRAVLLER